MSVTGDFTRRFGGKRLVVAFRVRKYGHPLRWLYRNAYLAPALASGLNASPGREEMDIDEASRCLHQL